MAFQVFISYATANKLTADAICARLEQANIRCWIAPRDIPPGASWPAAITHAVRQCSLMVLVFTNHSNSSLAVLKEVTLASNNSKPIVPFRTEDISPSDDLEFHLAATHWLDALTLPLERHIERLAITVQSLVARGMGLGPNRTSAKLSETTVLARYDPAGEFVSSNTPLAPVPGGLAVLSDLELVGFGSFTNANRLPVGLIVRTSHIPLFQYITFSLTGVCLPKIIKYSSYSYKNNGARRASLRSSVNQFADDLATLEKLSGATGPQTLIFDISRLGSLRGATTFRIYFYDAPSASNDWMDLLGSAGGGTGLVIEGSVQDPIIDYFQ